MAFTNNYDVTFPPDTQQANQLGADLRNLALNVQQRMAAISGLDAAKPSFGTDIQPLNWTGILFFATDTGNVYRWTGAAWVQVTFNNVGAPSGYQILYKNFAFTAHTGDTTEDVIYSFMLNGANLTATSGIRVRCQVAINTASGLGATLRFRFNGSALLTIQTSTNPLVEYFEYECLQIGSTNAQHNLFKGISNVGAAVVAAGSTAVAMGTAQTFEMTMQNAANSDSQTFQEFVVEQF